MNVGQPRKPKWATRVLVRQEVVRHGRWSWAALRHDLAVGFISGGVVAALSMLGQVYFDDRRSDREELYNQLRSVREGQQENLRFVRDRSSEQFVERPFQDIDLAGQNLSGLMLERADLAGANLEGAIGNRTFLRYSNLSSTALAGSKFIGADIILSDMRDADMSNAHFHSANLERTYLPMSDVRGAVFVLANLRGADFRVKNLEHAILVDDKGATVCYDTDTLWPDGFTPPPMPDNNACDSLWGIQQ